MCSDGYQVITYIYDGLLRLVEAVETPGTAFSYSYDLVGNRIAASQNGTLVEQRTYDDANECGKDAVRPPFVSVLGES